MTQYALLGINLNQQQEKIHKKIENKKNGKGKGKGGPNYPNYPGM